MSLEESTVYNQKKRIRSSYQGEGKPLLILEGLEDAKSTR